MPVILAQTATALLPIASTAFLLLMHSGPGEIRLVDDPRSAVAWRPLIASLVMLLAFRLEYALIRSLTPEVLPGGIGYLAVSLVIPVTLYGTFIVLALRNARAVDIDLAVVWTLPTLLFAFALVFSSSDALLAVSSVMNTIASIILQSFFWIIYAKAAEGDRDRGGILFACYVVGLAFGVSGGTLMGSALVTQGPSVPTEHAMPLMLVMAVATAVVMASWRGAHLLFSPADP